MRDQEVTTYGYGAQCGRASVRCGKLINPWNMRPHELVELES
jgi:hypothetical protein